MNTNTDKPTVWVAPELVTLAANHAAEVSKATQLYECTITTPGAGGVFFYGPQS